MAPFSNLNFFVKNRWKFRWFLQNFAKFPRILLNFDQILTKIFRDFPKMQHFSENCCILGIRHAVSSKVQGTVKVWKFKKVWNLNSTQIPICNPVCADEVTRVRRLPRPRTSAPRPHAETFFLRICADESTSSSTYQFQRSTVCSALLGPRATFLETG